MPGELLEWASDSEPALAKSCRSGHAGLVGQLLFTSLLLRRPVSLGPLSGFARRLQSPVEADTQDLWGSCYFHRCCCGDPFLWDRFRASPGACKVPSKRARRHADAARVHAFLKPPWCRPAHAIPDAPLQELPDALMDSELPFLFLPSADPAPMRSMAQCEPSPRATPRSANPAWCGKPAPVGITAYMLC